MQRRREDKRKIGDPALTSAVLAYTLQFGINKKHIGVRRLKNRPRARYRKLAAHLISSK
jgi:hypothetical protein